MGGGFKLNKFRHQQMFVTLRVICLTILSQGKTWDHFVDHEVLFGDHDSHLVLSQTWEMAFPPVFKIRKLRSREVKQLAWGPTADELQSGCSTHTYFSSKSVLWVLAQYVSAELASQNPAWAAGLGTQGVPILSFSHLRSKIAGEKGAYIECLHTFFLVIISYVVLYNNLFHSISIVLGF